MTAFTSPKTCTLALILGLVAATPAFAHHAMDGAMPVTFTQGLLSGLGHPVIGLDHLAALIGVGLVSSRFARGLALPAVWLVAMAAGVGLHLASADLPYAELLVALSVVIIGVAATIRTTLPFAIIALLFAAGGAVHGYALGESIVGAETTPLAAYLIGLVAIQMVLTTGITLAARRLAGVSFAAPSLQLRLAGLAVALVGATVTVLSLSAVA